MKSYYVIEKGQFDKVVNLTDILLVIAKFSLLVRGKLKNKNEQNHLFFVVLL